jgi:hypothetical protein
MIAVLFQYELPCEFLHLLVPTALTMDATHGPPVNVTAKLWSESTASGITHETPRNLQFVEMSDKTTDCCNSTFEVHSSLQSSTRARRRRKRKSVASSRTGSAIQFCPPPLGGIRAFR